MTHLNQSLEDALKDFKRSVEITRDVRFQANIRLSNHQRGSAYIVSLLSLYVIGLSLIPNILTLHNYQAQLLLACSVVLSVFVIFTSLIDGAQNYFHQGELLHQCARKIATIHHNLKNIDLNNPEIARTQLIALQKEYQQALDDCPINHHNVDFYKERAEKPHLFPMYYTWKKGNMILIQWNKLVSVIGSYTWLVLPLAAIAIISYVIYAFIFKDITNTTPHNSFTSAHISHLTEPLFFSVHVSNT